MSEREQCPLCLNYTDEPLEEVCEQCKDNAASYDTTKLERDKLAIAAAKARAILDKEELSAYDKGMARGLLNGALLLCEYMKEKVI